MKSNLLRTRTAQPPTLSPEGGTRQFVMKVSALVANVSMYALKNQHSLAPRFDADKKYALRQRAIRRLRLESDLLDAIYFYLCIGILVFAVSLAGME